MEEKTLVEAEKYLKTGSHIGTRFKSGEMKRFIFKLRKDGLKVLDVQTLDERIRLAARFLADYPKERIAAVSRKLYGQTTAKEFIDSVGGKAFIGRFVPGTFTNPEGKEFFEPKVLVVAEPDADKQAISEAKKLQIPVLALASTNNHLKNVDLVVPVNNKGRKSLALVYWLLARETLKERKELKKDEDFKKTPEKFEYQLPEGAKEEEEERGERRERGERGESRDRGERDRRDRRR